MTQRWEASVAATILAVVFSLLVVTAPVAAVDATTSVHTTTAELTAGSTTGLQAVSVGDGAVAMGVNGTTAARPNDEGSFSETGETGLVINPNTALSGVTITESSQTSGATTAYLRDSNNNLLASTSLTNGNATLYHPMDAGTTYYVTLDAGGNSWTYGTNTEGAYPYSSADVDITATKTPTGTTTAEAQAIKSVQAITTPPSASYTGVGHGDIDKAQAWANISLDNADATITWQGYDGSSWIDITSTTVSTSGNYSRDLGTADYQDYRTTVDVTPNTGGATFTLYDEGQSGPYSAPTFDNSSADPQGGEKATSDPVTLSIDVSDPDLGGVEGDSVTVEFIGNGNSLGTDTLTSNGTATYDWSVSDIGTQTWRVNATDEYGHSQESETFTFETPSNLTFRNETNASQIITGSDAIVTFYGLNGTVVVQKTDSDGDGNVSLSGLPNQAFAVTVSTTGYHDRRVYIDSIYEQQNIYLLNSSAYPTSDDSAIETTFVYEDRTGLFEQSNTTLEVQRAVDVNGDGDFEWTTVAGDFWGAAGEFPFTGQYQARYRLRIANQETGDSRLLGTHIPTGDGIKNIIVGKIIFEAENATGRYVDAGINSNTSNLQILYSDPANSTTDLQIVVHEQGNASNEIFNQTYAGPLGEKVITQSLTQNQTDTNWVVEYDVGDTADGPKFLKVVVGGGSFPLPIDGDILSAFAYVFITFVMALYGPRTALLGAWAGVFVFAGFAFLGWISGVTVAVPVLIAIGATFYNEASP